jgi:hypothetical protein
MFHNVLNQSFPRPLPSRTRHDEIFLEARCPWATKFRGCEMCRLRNHEHLNRSREVAQETLVLFARKKGRGLNVAIHMLSIKQAAPK